MATKKCFKCEEVKDLEEFYKHPMMGDGHLNKCKSCTKKDTKKRHDIMINDPKFLIKERMRNRLRQRRLRDAGLEKTYIKTKKYPKPLAVTMVGNAIKAGKILKAPCVVCGDLKSEGHHEDYNKPLDVVWLCIRHHSDRHIHLRDASTLGINPMNIDTFINELKILL